MEKSVISSAKIKEKHYKTP